MVLAESLSCGLEEFAPQASLQVLGPCPDEQGGSCSSSAFLAVLGPGLPAGYAQTLRLLQQLPPGAAPHESAGLASWWCGVFIFFLNEAFSCEVEVLFQC